MENQYQINTEWDDDEAYSGYYKESYDYGNDDEGILDDIGGAIKSGVSAVGSILTAPFGAAKAVGSSVGKILGVNTTPASTSGIPSQSNLQGKITTATGKQVPIALPPNVAAKQDINILQQAIQKINLEIKKVADTATNNGVALTKLTQEVKEVDAKHVAATKRQNDLIDKLGRGVDKLGKDLKETKSQAQMNMMLPLLIQPSLSTLTFDATPTADKPVNVKTTSWNDNNSMLFLMMAMGSGGEGGGFGDMGSNPMMMYFMMQAMNPPTK